MATWGELLDVLRVADDGDAPPSVDDVRRHYIAALSALTGRSTVVYATDFLNQPDGRCSISLLDMQGLMETFNGLPRDGLDLILHSPGGQAEAVERLATYMRRNS